MNEIRDPNWMTHLWQRVKSLFSGLDARVTALEQGGGGGGGAVSGVKGDAEATYRTGAVNLTAANIGAKAVQAAVSDPVASGTAVEFIAGISQDTQGVITPTKKTVASASQSADGLMSSADKTKLDKIDYAIYDSVTDLGLTSGSATILSVFNAMAVDTILICIAGEFASSEVPTPYGTVKIVKSSAAARSYLYFWGKGSTHADYRMYLEASAYNGNSGDLPSGAWVQLVDINDITKIGNGLFYLGSIDHNSTKDLTTDSSAHAILVLSGPNTNLFGIYMIRLGSTAPNTVTILQGSYITFTESTGKITIGNTNNTSSLAVSVIPITGDSSNFHLT